MALPLKQITVAKALRRYFYARTAQLKSELIYRGLLHPSKDGTYDADGSITRGVLRAMEKLGYIRRHEPKMVAESGTAAPIFGLTLKGSAALAAELGDCKYLLPADTTFRDWISLNHHCQLTSLHQLTDRAFESQNDAYVRLNALAFEHEIIRPEAEGAARYRLATTISESPRVLCCPDSLMEIECKGYSRALYTEYETGSDGSPARVAAKKHKGYAGLAAKNLFKRHAPTARDFRVLCFCPYASFRDHLRKEMKDKTGAEYWFFCDTREVTAQSFLHGDIFYSATKGPFPLVPPPSPGGAAGEESDPERGEENGHVRKA